MKTNLTIIAAFVASVAISQIKVDSVIPNRLCPGDSISVYYIITGPDSLVQVNMDGFNHDYIWQIKPSASGVSKLKTPFWWNGGKAKVSGDWFNSVDIDFCEAVGIKEHELTNKINYKQIYGNVYLSSEGKKVIFVEP